MPKNVILNAWRVSDLMDVPESENIDLEIIEDSEDEYVELELCAKSQKLFDLAENETDDYPDELNAPSIENFEDTYIDEDPLTQPDSSLASPSTSSKTVKK